ncbi:recombinase family protein [Ruminiclostridium josui]|uniref:recombinase family protein n=2 Tax=Ruminiclostridium josui TaxID=1499 RepID=UPI0004B7E542|nr:recombinase family protein [Ruminiclostridium josui]
MGYDKDESGNLIINEKQAKIVRRIYTDYLNGKGPNRIVKELEKEGVPNWNGLAKWYESSIRKMLSNEKYKGDALLQKTYTVDFLSKKRVVNNGEVPQYYVEESHPAIIEKETWEAVQLEKERRRAFAEKYGLKRGDYATTENPFAGRVICGCCGGVYGRKVWNSTNERLRRIVWQCNNKYATKGKKGCDNRHINDEVLYMAFVSAFNTVLENREHFMSKWNEQINSQDILKRVTAKRFIDIFKDVEPLQQFDAELYFKMVEKITVYEDSRLIVSLLDGSEVECGIR